MCRHGHGEGSRNFFDPSVQGQFSDEQIGCDAFLSEDAFGDEDANGNAQLQACPFLFDAGGRQVDGNFFWEETGSRYFSEPNGHDHGSRVPSHLGVPQWKIVEARRQGPLRFQ